MTPKVPDGYLDARRAQILEAAARCFAREGFHGATMGHIASEAGLSAGALYRYFEDRADLIRALAEESGRRLREAIASRLGAGDSPVEALEGLVRAHVERLTGAVGRESARLTARLWAEALHTPELRRELAASYRTVRSELAELLRRGQRDGTVRADLEAEAVATVLIALIQDVGLQALIDPELDLDGYVSVVGSVLREVVAGEGRADRAGDVGRGRGGS
ncbi:MAG: TetR family transcriptional regulator [Gemmatimonadota bacterium]